MGRSEREPRTTEQAVNAATNNRAPECVGSEAVTQGVRIRVSPRYFPAESAPEENRFVFVYHITVTNEGDERVKLLSRHWVIVDGEGERREVRGEGVVGQTPELEPGGSHEYESYCPLPTHWGTMEGSFQMRRDNGETFDAMIDRFFLVAPQEGAEVKA
ncbi:MAG: Co2+/Mg2+ efflux protein ApaG [Phycisphaeraceae bacterium]|nr:MAG: Co2+/Mg2+ efflux protein ApaG [Phycisphaeraceae bacterium]